MMDNEPGRPPLINDDLSTATSFHSYLNLKEAYSIALDTVLGITAFDIVMVYLVDENTNEAVLQAHRGLTEDYIRKAGRIPYPKGVTWRVINSGELTFIDNIQKDPDIGSAGRALGHHTVIMVPIKQEEKTIGVINFCSCRVLELNSRDISLLNTIGNQIGTAIVQAYLYEELNRRNKNLEILDTVTQAVSQSPNLQEIYRIALDKVIELESVDIACIYLVDKIKNEAVMQEQRNLPEEFIQRAGRIPYPKGVTWKVINTGKLLNVRNAEQDPDVGPAGRDLGFRSMLGIPINLDGRTIGVIWLLSYREHLFTRSEEELLTSIGTQIAVVISRAKQTKELEERNRNLSTLSAISQVVNKSSDLNQIFKAVLDVTKELEFIDLMSVYLVEGEGDKREAVLRINKGHDEEYLKRASRIPYGRGVTWKVITSGEPVFYEDASDPSTVVGPAGKALGARALLSIPINSGKETIGVAHFSSLEKTSFTQQESDFILSLANQTGVAIAKTKMLEEMKQREEALRESEERFSLFMRNLPGVAFMKDVKGHHIYVNETWEKIFHKKLSDWFGKTDDEIWPSTTATQFKESDRVAIESRKAFQTIETTQHEDGIHYWLSSKFPILGKKGNPTMVGGIAIDITERKLAEETLRQSEERYRTLFDQSSVGVYIFDKDLKITQCNERMVRILGSSYDKIIGLDMRRLKDQSFIPAMENVFEGQSCHQESFYQATTSSAKLWLSISLSPLRDADGNVIGGMGVVEDITERKRQEERIHYLATHDYLTNLPNRRVLEENLKRAVDRSQREHMGALLLIDLDNFKMVNDTLGHLGGDQLLITLAQRLRRSLRPGDLLARFGGDEFALLVEWVSVEEIKAIAERIYRGVTESHFHMNNHSIDLTICIGIALIDGGLNDQAVLALADSALYAAKNFGKSRIVLYQGEDDKQFKLAEIGQWASRIKDALREEHFVLFFQPVIQLRSGEIGYFEALIRLRNESGEIILPGEFISAAERFGLMPQIDRWIIQRVLRILRTRPDLRIFINLSGQSLRDASLLEFTKTCIQESRVTPGQLSFEIIETVAATDLVRVQHWMKQLKELGCLFALDDFGIGFSTFSYLHALPVDYIKIDGSFIHNLDTDPANRAIVQAIATVANALNKEVIAEWVENKAVTETLRELGVKYGQGYMWGIPSAEIHGAS